MSENMNMMRIITFHSSADQQRLIDLIDRCDWGAAHFLAELLREDKFHSTLGGEGELYIILEGERLASFATLTRQDCIADESLWPWVGFVYTAPEYRGRRLAGRLLAHIETAAAARGLERLYIATDHIGLYEKYGYSYIENRVDVWGEDSRIYAKTLSGREVRVIKSMEDKYLQPSLELVRQVFTDHENAAEAAVVCRLVEEIRAGRFYLPQLELIMVDAQDEVIGYVMFSRFHLEGRYENQLLMLTPAAVSTALQRQHISKQLIEFGFERAREMGFGAVIVEGNPANYRARGFVTAADHGILPGATVQLPAIECLMVKELIPGALDNISGKVEYDDYSSLVSGAN